MARIIFLIAFVSVFETVRSAVYPCAGTAQYAFSFYGNWSNMTHPNAFPSGGHFSPPIGCSHENLYTMWDVGVLASQGVADVAETGNSTALEYEIMQRIMTNRTAWQQFKASDAVNGTGHAMGITFWVTKDFPLVSFVSMIAPSPDWFTGIKKVDLCDSTTGIWKDTVNIDMLDPWDAGTDSGTTFTAADSPENSPANILKITKTPPPVTDFKNISGPLLSLGRVMFQRQNIPPMTVCSGSPTYNIKFEGMWTRVNHPNGYPPNAHFSALVGAIHTYRYKFWSGMTRASPGVEMVAEIGNHDTLFDEINSMKKDNYVLHSYKATGPLDPTGKSDVDLTFQGKYSRISLISMLAPSPDWFVGVDSLELCNADGTWKDEIVMLLNAWDAGTENGRNFSINNMATTPPDVIRLITSQSDTVVGANADVPFGKITIKKKPATVTPNGNAANSLTVSVLSTLLSIALMSILRLLY